MTIAVVDYGMGNLRSVAKALEHVTREPVEVTDEPERIAAAARVVFPGQGAVRDCMSALQRRELVGVLLESLERCPFLGICMGMQALMTDSEENEGVAALDVCAGHVRHLRPLVAGDRELKVPHMGWNNVRQVAPHPLWSGIEDATRFYFVHSYYVAPDQPERVVGTTEYGAEFAVAIAWANVFATQFHPEKSQRPGLQLLENFSRWDGGL